MTMINGSQIRGARGLLNWTQDDLAETSKVSRKTIRLIESDEPARTSNIKKIQQTLTDHGIEFMHGYGVKLRSKDLCEFTGPESCDEFFDYVLKTMKERGGDLICIISELDILTKAASSSGLTNIERLEQLQKFSNVKCLIQDKIETSFETPTFEIRVLPEEPTIIPISAFAFGNQWVGGFLDDYKTNFTFVVFNKASLMHKCQNYFMPRWHVAKQLPAAMKTKKVRS